MGATPHAPELRREIEEVLYAGCLHLDARRFGDWLELTAPEFSYRVEAYSPDLRKDMVWLEHDRRGLAALVEILPKHHLDGAGWLRHAVLYTVTSTGPDAVRTVSSLALFRTMVDVGDVHVDGGSSHVFAVGRYHDTFRRERGRWWLASRSVRLDTRQLGLGSHVFP